MNFASDNAAGIAPAILAAIERCQRRGGARLWPGSMDQAGRAPVRGGFRARGRGLSGRDRDRRQCACARPFGAALGRGAVPRRIPCCNRRMRRAGILRRRDQAHRACGRGRQDRAADLAPCPRCRAMGRPASRQPRGVVAVAGHRSRDDLSCRRNPQPCRYRACARNGRAYGRRAARQRACADECLPGAGDLAGRCRCALIRCHQGRCARGRSDRVLRSARAPCTCRSGASAAVISSPSIGSSPPRSRPIFADGSGWNWRATPMPWPIGSRPVCPPRVSIRSGRWRRTRCSSRFRRPCTGGSRQRVQATIPGGRMLCRAVRCCRATPCWCAW